MFDVIEIDAASETCGIDEIRALRDAVKFPPSVTKMRQKVYIIDEAHMLTKEGANAFLKTLEEPPPHVTFIPRDDVARNRCRRRFSRAGQRYAHFAAFRSRVMIARMREISARMPRGSRSTTVRSARSLTGPTAVCATR